MKLQEQTQALLDLVEADRSLRCTQILGEAGSRAAQLLAQARGEARARMRAAFAEQRQRRDEGLADAHARLATQRRLHEQQHDAALLRQAWQSLPAALLARWRRDSARAQWVACVLAAARERLPRGNWRIVHAPDWPAQEQQAQVAALTEASGGAPRFEAEPSMHAGLKVVVAGHVIDGSLEGLLADRQAIEARLLRELEESPP